MVPTLRDVCLYVLNYTDKTGIPCLPTVGVAHFINGGGVLLDVEDLGIVERTLESLAFEGLVNRQETSRMVVYSKNKNTPAGLSPNVDDFVPIKKTRKRSRKGTADGITS